MHPAVAGIVGFAGFSGFAVLVVLVILALFRARRRITLRDVLRRYDTIGSTKGDPGGDPSGDPGGLLVHLVTAARAEALLAEEKFELTTAFVADCSDTGTCSAWTYLRRDLAPVVLNSPLTRVVDGERVDATLSVGLVADPAKLWPFISTMAVVDADSDHRSCGQTFGARTSHFNCFPGEQRAGSLTLPAGNASSCPADCEAGDDRCRAQNAGGGVHASSYGCDGQSAACRSGDPAQSRNPEMRSNWGCAHREAMVQLPNICTVDSERGSGRGSERGSERGSKRGSERAANSGAGWGRQAVEETPGFGQNATVHVAPGAFYRLATGPEGGPPGLEEPFVVAASQCKFRREDWEAWLAALKELYRAWADSYAPDGRSLATRVAPGSSYLLGCHSWAFLENEVNLYFRPKHPDQDAALRDAIVAVFYVGRTCTEMLAELEGVPCTTLAGETRTTAAERCAAYACPGDPACVQKFVTEEAALVAARRDTAQRLQRAFNGVYRRRGPKVPLLKYVGGSSIYLGRGAGVRAPIFQRSRSSSS